jgi:hypothetical protein
MQNGKRQTEPSWAHESLIQLNERQGPRNRLLNAKSKINPIDTESHTSPIPVLGVKGEDTGTDQTVLAPRSNYMNKRNS